MYEQFDSLGRKFQTIYAMQVFWFDSAIIYQNSSDFGGQAHKKEGSTKKGFSMRRTLADSHWTIKNLN